MTCEYKYQHILEEEDRNQILKLVLRGTKPELIAEWHGLTKQFIKVKFENEINAKGIDIGSKQIPYYTDEMMYGNNTHKYTIEDLNSNELKAYNEYEQKTNKL